MNYCYEIGTAYQAIVFYSHLVPMALGLFLGGYALFQTHFSKLAVFFFAFTVMFSLWLAGDIFTWTFYDYSLAYYTWSWLDFVNIAFFVLGAYFFAILARERVSIWERITFVLLCVPAFLLTVTGQSVAELYQPICEVTNNTHLTSYKLFAEALSLIMMFASLWFAWGRSDTKKRIQLSVILLALVLFFAVFSGTEYIASTTGVYEINLYGLFVLPLFLLILTFAITDLRLFQFRFLGTQILAYVLIIMVGSQLLFIEDSTSRNLSLITLAVSMFMGLLLIENSKREAEARIRIETLAKELGVANQQLDTSNKQQIILIHFITHQIKGFVTKSRNIFSMIRDGDFGVVPETMKPMVEEGFNSDTKGVATIQEILNAANIKSGKVAYSKEPFDLKAVAEEIVRDLKVAAESKGLVLGANLGDAPLMYPGDKGQLVNALKNLVDNSIKYTPKGEVTVTLVQEGKTVRFTVKDTGVGITKEDMMNLFTEGGHGANSTKINVESTGFGLYIVKNIIEAHGGKVWAESEGEGKGSKFVVELPI